MVLESLESKPIKAVKNMRNSESDKFGWQVEFGRKDTRRDAQAEYENARKEAEARMC